MTEYIGWLDGEFNIVLDQEQEIVRCRDCKHYCKRLGNWGVCVPLGIVFADMDDGFCKWAERRADA